MDNHEWKKKPKCWILRVQICFEKVKIEILIYVNLQQKLDIFCKYFLKTASTMQNQEMSEYDHSDDQNQDNEDTQEDKNSDNPEMGNGTALPAEEHPSEEHSNDANSDDGEVEHYKIQEPEENDTSFKRHQNQDQDQKAKTQQQGDIYFQLRDLAMKYQPLPTHSVPLLEDFINRLMEERKQKMVGGDFEGGVTMLRVIDHAKEYLNIAEKKKFQKMQKEQVSKAGNEVQDRIARFDQETAEMETRLKKQLQRSREKLISQLQKQADTQEEMWQSESHRRLYNRPSYKLRELKYQANQMIACGRFRDAEKVLQTARVLQENESKQGAFQMQKDYENATKLFDQKVKEDLQTFDIDAMNQIETLRAKRATQRTVFQNQIKKVEQRSELVNDMDRCWNANYRQIVEKKMTRKSGPQELPRTTRYFGKTFRERQESIVLTLPKLNPKKPMEKPLPSATYL